MRLFVLVLAFGLLAEPAWAHEKMGFALFASPAIQNAFEADPCGVSHNPHQIPGMLSVSLRCRRILAEWRAAPGDETAHARCDRIARALTNGRCTLGA